MYILTTAIFFIAVISIVVFVHEFGHYIIARWAGVKIEVFSIGFGRELIGWNDRSGTRWKISALPLGGYVKMYGDASEASNPSSEIFNLSEEEKAKTFHHKPLYKKAAIVAAGPIFNFLLTILILAGFYISMGVPFAEPVVDSVVKDSVAESAGILAGDRILKINGNEVYDFSDISSEVFINLGTPITLNIARQGKNIDIILTPKIIEDSFFGRKAKHGSIGVAAKKIFIKVGVFGALKAGVVNTYNICVMNLKGIGQILVGKRSASESVQGPVSMAKMAGNAADGGIYVMITYIALISVSLGLVNLFPIPVLDGGHLLMYLIQAITGRPMNEKLQEYSFRLGMALISMLMAFAIINDFWPGVFAGK